MDSVEEKSQQVSGPCTLEITLPIKALSTGPGQRSANRQGAVAIYRQDSWPNKVIPAVMRSA